jgi:hypothetical protein
MTATTTIEIDDTDTDIIDTDIVDVWFEACTEHRGDLADGPCTQCGWLAGDHTAGLAEAVSGPWTSPARPLRRAS